jgi:hypothetical protein
MYAIAKSVVFRILAHKRWFLHTAVPFSRKVASTSKPVRNRVCSRFAGEDVQASFEKDEIYL